MEKLAWFYYKGEYVKKDLAKALYYFDYAYMRGNKNIAYTLGDMHYKGIGTKIDKNKGLEYYKIASKNGNIEGIKKLEELKKLGIIKTKTLKEEFDFIKESSSENNTVIFEKYRALSDKGYAPAIFELASFYEKGLGVEQDYKKAIELYEKAAELDNFDAMERLYEIYKGNPNYPRNEEKMKYYINLLATTDDYYIYRLGMIRLEDKEYKKAYNLFYHLAEKDEGLGYVGLGIMLRDGLEIKQDYIEAYKYIKYAWDEKNNYLGVYNLAWFYENGIVVEKDLNEAFENYKTASNFEIEEAHMKCGELYEQGIGHGYAVTAEDYYRMAAIEGNAEAMNRLADLYEKGTYGDKSKKWADYWREKAGSN